MTRMERACFQLIELLNITDAGEPLIGDLLEEVCSGRSCWWLVRQVLMAVAGSIFRETLGNKLLSLSAMATGAVVAIPLAVVFKRLAYFSWANGPLPFCFFNCFTFVVAGAAVAHKYPKHRPAMVTAFALHACAARASLVGFNVHQFFGPAHPFQDLAYATISVLAPIFALIGSFPFLVAKPRPKDPLKC